MSQSTQTVMEEASLPLPFWYSKMPGRGMVFPGILDGMCGLFLGSVDDGFAFRPTTVDLPFEISLVGDVFTIQVPRNHYFLPVLIKTFQGTDITVKALPPP